MHNLVGLKHKPPAVEYAVHARGPAPRDWLQSLSPFVAEISVNVRATTFLPPSLISLFSLFLILFHSRVFSPFLFFFFFLFDTIRSSRGRKGWFFSGSIRKVGGIRKNKGEGFILKLIFFSSIEVFQRDKIFFSICNLRSLFVVSDLWNRWRSRNL